MSKLLVCIQPSVMVRPMVEPVKTKNDSVLPIANRKNQKLVKFEVVETTFTHFNRKDYEFAKGDFVYTTPTMAKDLRAQQKYEIEGFGEAVLLPLEFVVLHEITLDGLGDEEETPVVNPRGDA